MCTFMCVYVWRTPHPSPHSPPPHSHRCLPSLHLLHFYFYDIFIYICLNHVCVVFSCRVMNGTVILRCLCTTLWTMVWCVCVCDVRCFHSPLDLRAGLLGCHSSCMLSISS